MTESSNSVQAIRWQDGQLQLLDQRLLPVEERYLACRTAVETAAAIHDMVVRGDYSKPSFALTVPTLLTSVRTDCPEGSAIVEILTAADWER